MTYTFKKTERNNLKAAVFETKSLLYLAAQGSKYKNITVLTIDCFNDVSGLCPEDKIWDVQAKNEKGLTPRKIGSYLITLYENFISHFKPFFQEFIFFMPHLKTDYIEDPSLEIYTINNFKEPHKKRLIEGLVSKANLDKNANLTPFFEKVLFVEDRSQEKDYVKGLMRFKSSKLSDDNFYKAIFNEIRDKQVALKNSEIEGVCINEPSDVLKLERGITTEQLQVFVLNRFVGGDVFKNSIKCPFSYNSFIKNLSEDDLEDHLYEQNAALSRAFFDKNNQKYFWKLFEAIFKSFYGDKRKRVNDVMNSLNNSLIHRVEHMNYDSTRFLVAMVRDGMINDN